MEKRLSVGFVKGDSDINDGDSLVYFCVAELGVVDVARLQILVGRVVRNVDAVSMVSLRIPVIKETKNLILGDG